MPHESLFPARTDPGGFTVRHLFILVLLVAFTGCGGGVDEVPEGQSATLGGAPSEQASAGGSFEGTVTETMNAGGYTYVLVDTGTEKHWAAGPQQAMEVGTHVQISTAMPMQNFHSSALERDFDVVYFVGEFGDHDHAEGEEGHAASGGMPPGHGSTGGMPPGHGAMGGGAEPAGEVDLGGITPADQTVAAVYAEKGALAGKPVKVRGKVVKALSGIMGTNWLHLQDGTGSTGTNDLTVTGDFDVPVGSTVLVEGNLTVDKDFGSGYRYAVIIENAKVTVE